MYHTYIHRTSSDPNQRHLHQFYTKPDLHIRSHHNPKSKSEEQLNLERFFSSGCLPKSPSILFENIIKRVHSITRLPFHGIWHLGRTSIPTFCLQHCQTPPRFLLLNHQTSSNIGYSLARVTNPISPKAACPSRTGS